MTKFFNISVLFLIIFAFPNCSQVLENVQLQINSADDSTQEEFNVIEKTLTSEEARKQNNTPYKREILQTGTGGNAQSIPESVALRSSFPQGTQSIIYKIGVGDTLSFSRLIENNRSEFDFENQWPTQFDVSKYKLGIGDTIALTLVRDDNNIQQLTPIGNENASQNLIINSQQEDPTINSAGRIGSDGSVLLLEVGRLEANGKTLNEIRSEVRNNLIRNGVSPRFQLEITEFKSQKVYLTVNNTSKIIILDNQQTTLRDILTSANVGFQPGIVTRVSLHRGGKKYPMSLRKIYSEDAPELNIIASDHIFVEDSSAAVITNLSTVSHDGHVVFAGVGKLKAAGRSLDELEKDISSMIEKLPNSENAFLIEIKEPLSQTATVNIPGKSGGIIPISEVPKALDQVLTENGLSIDGEKITRITLNRQDKTYTFSLEDLLKNKKNKIYLQSNDRLFVEMLSYKDNKIFILGAVEPKIFKIDPSKRETLADVLFTDGGVISSINAKRSEVYLLRGKDPVVAFHLDAQSPTRLIVADAMELRPNDILYVAEQPIISFNRALATIVPLRILLRDIQDENIP